MAERKRYSKDEKNKIIEFIEQFNDNHNGRGGFTAAVKKFKVSMPTLMNWTKGSGNPIGNQVASPSSFVAKRPVGRPRKVPTIASNIQSEIMMHLEAIDRYNAQILEFKQAIQKEKDAIRNLTDLIE